MEHRVLGTDDLLFVSFNSRVIAVDRTDGSVVWRWKAPRGLGGLVTMLPSEDRLFVSSNGYTWALDPRDGSVIWHQPFRGEGTGIPMLATMRSVADAGGAAAAQQAAAASAGAATAAAAGAAAAAG